MTPGAPRRIAQLTIVLLAGACGDGAKRVDFSDGGAEIELHCKGERDAAVAPARVQATLARALPKVAFETTQVRRTLEHDEEVLTTLVRTNLVAVSDRGSLQDARDAIMAKVAERDIVKAVWSGDRLHVRTMHLITWQEAALVFAGAGVELKPWEDWESEAYTHPNGDTGEYDERFSLLGLDRHVQRIIETALAVRCRVLRFETVGSQRR